ncbi:MAG TPA: flagellar hook capping FlgD N-terminal domain-containing protein [candidate division Zixibacteria bacterium]|nr:flagellar hook capping FlgD N-terminal domain-containing protein [candidate division Zixibacteria bacterium]
MSVQAVGNSHVSGGPGSALPSKTVTQEDFLKLLIAQLQNQDPLQPMDNQEFAAQLATFNSLGQLIEINGKLGALQDALGFSNRFNAAALVGKEISAAGSQVGLVEGRPAEVGYRLEANAARVVVDVYDTAGKLLRQIEAGAQAAGDRALVWDGKNAAGAVQPPGPYFFEVSAFDASGKSVPVSGRIRGAVTGVRLDGAEPVLEIGAVQVPLSSVVAIGPQAAAAAAAFSRRMP